MDSFYFDVNDILNENLMPAALFADHPDKSFVKGSKISREQFFNVKETDRANFSSAFSTMEYHRKMMNEYLATNFLANEVIGSLVQLPSQQLGKRLGKASVGTSQALQNVTDGAASAREGRMLSNGELIYDQGSTGYKNWLEKTTTLEDIQRQFVNGNLISDNPVNSTKNRLKGRSKINRRQGYDDYDQEYEDYDEGDVTGYAYTGSNTQQKFDNPFVANTPNMVQYPHPYTFVDSTSTVGSTFPSGISKQAKSGYYQPSGHESYEDYGVQSMQGGSSKELGFKDIMDIALTTLAFLSFGMFILQVLMCITMNKDDNNNLMMMPMEMDGGDVDNGTEEIRRRKRSTQFNNRIKKINEISRRVLMSIEAVQKFSEDDGTCHLRILCENNKFARQQNDGQGIWMPVWSLGVSWLSSRFASVQTQSSAILSSLKASAIGLGNGNCEEHYRGCEFSE